jgi:hypothetical protein
MVKTLPAPLLMALSTRLMDLSTMHITNERDFPVPN